MISRTPIGVFTQIWSHLTGMNVMMYYTTYVFAMACLSGNNPLASSSIQYVLKVILTVPALLFIDRWGRRPTLLLGTLGMTTWMFANGGLLKPYGHSAGPDGRNHTLEASWSISGSPAKAVIACSYLFVASHAPPRRTGPLNSHWATSSRPLS
ncbi:MAG: hypothetical protein Q9161_000557 [Pseudevernia consocians]